MKFRSRGDGGFTLIELMIVVVIIGILAAMAIPRFMLTNVKAKQSEAKNILKQVFSMEQAYKQEFDKYWGNGISASATASTAFNRIQVEIMPSARYSYTIVAGTNSFTCTAICSNLDDDATVDTWTITQLGELLALSNDALL
jgi:prepilin-type N-terminal cleavage/methylation domain-containing protein